MVSGDIGPNYNSRMAKESNENDGCREQTVGVRLTDIERIEYQKAAERCGLSLSEWIREQLAEAAKRQAKEA
jgi:hypothetical protein